MGGREAGWDGLMDRLQGLDWIMGKMAGFDNLALAFRILYL
jgi:hypothetical protein